MVKLNHLRIAVGDYRASRDWYVENIGLRPEFEIRRRRVAGLQDDGGNTLILEQGPKVQRDACVLYFEVDDVEEKYNELVAKGLRFVHPPRRRFWGYGAELRDPDRYRIRLWDERTMKERG